MDESPPLRLFFAVPVEPPPEVVRLVGRLSEFRPHLRPVAVDRMHLTLRFLGMVQGKAVVSQGKDIYRREIVVVGWDVPIGTI